MKKNLSKFFQALKTAVISLNIALLASFSQQAQATPVISQAVTPHRYSEFKVPAQLRPRVNFWKDVYAKYGKYQVVFHHRTAPQAVFGVLDLSSEASSLNPVAFESYKKKTVEAEIKDIEGALRSLAAGQTPAPGLETQVYEAMQKVPGGPGKYKQAIDDDLVRSQTGIRERFIEAIERSGRYLPMIEKIFVEEFGLPYELSRLPFVESSFDYMAYSSVGAAGIWQFMPRTAKLYMTVNSAVDERRDPVKSSRAAARYLTEAHRRIGTWPLTIISYNHGVGGVIKRMRDMGTSDIVTLIEYPTDKPFGFASSNFYPCFLAALEVYEERKLLFPGIREEPPMRVAEQRVSRSMSAKYASKQLGVPLEDLKAVNYALMDRVWSGRSNIPAGYALKIPLGATSMADNLLVPEPQIQEVAPPSSSIYGGTVYKVRKGDTLVGIAKKYGVSVAQLQDLNKLNGNKIGLGQNLVIKQKETQHNKEARVEETQVSSVVRKEYEISPPTVNPSFYEVRAGDTLNSVSRKLGVPLADLRKANNLKADRVHVGQKLVVVRNTLGSSEHQDQAVEVSEVVAPKTEQTIKVKSGDSLWSISKQAGISTSELKRINKLKSDKLKPGQTLRLE